jgi:transposase
MSRRAFGTCIQEVLVPEISPGTVVILDNLATYRNKDAEKVPSQHGRRFLYLLPCSPKVRSLQTEDFRRICARS